MATLVQNHITLPRNKCETTTNENQSNASSEFTLPSMTKKELRRSALEHGGYSTPALNDQLYLHYMGYRKIENLEEYTNLKAIWLDSNGFETIENLNHLSQLRCLFLQRNLFTNIQNLHGLNNLVQLDLSENRLTKIEGLSCLPLLSTLNVSKNALSDADSISHLADCKKLTTVDFTSNSLRGETIIDALAAIPALISINMTGNPAASEVTNFRKRVIASIKTLRYLDRPVFDMERATTEAWASGGRSAELAMKKQLLDKKRQEERAATNNFRLWQEEVRAKVKENQQQMLLNGGPSSEQLIEIELKEQKKKERQAAAAEEAAREREIYRIELEPDGKEVLLLGNDGEKSNNVQVLEEDFTVHDNENDNNDDDDDDDDSSKELIMEVIDDVQVKVPESNIVSTKESPVGSTDGLGDVPSNNYDLSKESTQDVIDENQVPESNTLSSKESHAVDSTGGFDDVPSNDKVGAVRPLNSYRSLNNSQRMNYQELSNIGVSSVLKVPTKFPSVRDYEEEGEENE